MCVCVLVRVLRASIMYLDNAAASLYQEQLTGIPTHRGRQRMRGKERERETQRQREQEGKQMRQQRRRMRKGNVSDRKM